ncbi:serine/threonine-protein kinase [Pleurocapsa sp. PCC 7319]|uniref:serine/threonine protein kinase n=1 Tax=Pleurocapsa sp. PCC 7319 TaxID=118161 RepID=UPI00034CB0A9|nr:serine/threonine-protein kinase [Pleurocapsa sp. PCC 7319]
MYKSPNLTNHGYEINTELGRNREGGRITWQGINLTNQQTVIVKQFCFATTDSSWSGYKAYEQEIQVLEKLNHPRIPRYLESIETEDGFCLIQEYKPASNLKNFRQLTLLEIKQIALELLDILIYLQQQNPPILHRDLKPENILLDQQLNVYLVDFGFASLGSREVSGSSVFQGTPGFMAPEQIIKPTLASDIYSLGITIVCLLTNKDITEIRNLASKDDPYQLDLKSLLPKLDRQFRHWLSKMTYSKASKRFPDALTAKNALLSITVVPELQGKMTQTNVPQLTMLIKPKIMFGILSISGLSTIAVKAILFADSRIEHTFINMAIAIIAAMVITITQLGAVQIVQADQQEKLEGFALTILIPVLLVSASGLLWGMGEAVGVTSGIIVAEIITVSYCWLQIPAWRTKSFQLRFATLLMAIASGITLGLKLI